MEVNPKKKILFVDDEVNILNGLRRMLRPMATEWHMEFVDNGFDALNLLKNDNYDIIVTDMQMPRMNGAELLEKVQKEHPDVIRIILSGYTQFETAVKVMGLAHQFLTKPCDIDKLHSTISKAFLLRNILKHDALVKIVNEMESLPSLPDVYLKLRDLLKSSDVSMDRVAKLISTDAGMSAKILQLVNSSFFGLPHHIKDIGHAVKMLGLEAINTLVVSVHMFSLLDTGVIKNFPMHHLKEHNMLVANFAKRLAEVELVDKKAADDAFVYGILHDCGRIVLIQKMPEKYKLALNLVKAKNYSIHDAEKEVFGTTHADIGAYLLGLWGMPDAMLETVLFHHKPSESMSQTIDVLTCIHVADYLSYEFTPEINEHTRIELDVEYLERLNAKDLIEKWRDVCKDFQSKGALQ